MLCGHLVCIVLSRDEPFAPIMGRIGGQGGDGKTMRNLSLLIMLALSWALAGGVSDASAKVGTQSQGGSENRKDSDSANAWQYSLGAKGFSAFDSMTTEFPTEQQTAFTQGEGVGFSVGENSCLGPLDPIGQGNSDNKHFLSWYLDPGALLLAIAEFKAEIQEAVGKEHGQNGGPQEHFQCGDNWPWCPVVPEPSTALLLGLGLLGIGMRGRRARA